MNPLFLLLAACAPEYSQYELPYGHDSVPLTPNSLLDACEPPTVEEFGPINLEDDAYDSLAGDFFDATTKNIVPYIERWSDDYTADEFLKGELEDGYTFFSVRYEDVPDCPAGPIPQTKISALFLTQGDVREQLHLAWQNDSASYGPDEMAVSYFGLISSDYPRGMPLYMCSKTDVEQSDYQKIDLKWYANDQDETRRPSDAFNPINSVILSALYKTNDIEFEYGTERGDMTSHVSYSANPQTSQSLFFGTVLDSFDSRGEDIENTVFDLADPVIYGQHYTGSCEGWRYVQFGLCYCVTGESCLCDAWEGYVDNLHSGSFSVVDSSEL